MVRECMDPNPRDGSPRENIDTGTLLGQAWDNKKKQLVDTSRIRIVYSKKGAHVYPIK